MKKLTREQMVASLEAIERDIAAQDATVHLPNYDKLKRSAEKLREGIYHHEKARQRRFAQKELQ